MKTPVVIVTAALTVATLLAASFLIATGTRGEDTAFASSAGQLEVQTAASGLVHPWALAFLPDGRMLVTERPGRMRKKVELAARETREPAANLARRPLCRLAVSLLMTPWAAVRSRTDEAWR
jgi:glucose/arabinose dehydrogenase